MSVSYAPPRVGEGVGEAEVELVAVPRHTRARRRSGATRAAVQHDPQTDEAIANAATALEDLGLERSRDPADAPNSFSVLPETGAVYVACSVAKSEEAIGQLQGEFFVCPNVPFDLPRPERGVASTADSSQQKTWPEETGIGEAHDTGNRGNGVVIGIIDTGCDADHSEFRDRIVEFVYVPLSADGYRRVRGFDPDGHGTHVTGIAAGRTVGIAPEAIVLAASVIESERLVTSMKRLVLGLEWFERRLLEPDLEYLPAILNLSLGFRPEALSATSTSEHVTGVIKQLLATLVETYDVLPVVATGNEHPLGPRLPSYFPGVLSVGAVDEALGIWPKSCGGPGPVPFQAVVTPTLVGYGVDVRSSHERDPAGNSQYCEMTGTSMATPYVTGVAALSAAATGLGGVDLADQLVADAMGLGHPPDRVGAGLARVSSGL